MTYYVTALTNDRAQLIVHELRTSDIRAADFMATSYKLEGFKVVRRQEG